MNPTTPQKFGVVLVSVRGTDSKSKTPSYQEQVFYVTILGPPTMLPMADISFKNTDDKAAYYLQAEKTTYFGNALSYECGDMPSGVGFDKTTGRIFINDAASLMNNES